MIFLDWYFKTGLEQIIPWIVVGGFLGGMILTYMVILLTRFITRNDND